MNSERVPRDHEVTMHGWRMRPAGFEMGMRMLCRGSMRDHDEWWSVR